MLYEYVMPPRKDGLKRDKNSKVTMSMVEKKIRYIVRQHESAK